MKKNSGIRKLQSINQASCILLSINVITYKIIWVKFYMIKSKWKNNGLLHATTENIINS